MTYEIQELPYMPPQRYRPCPFSAVCVGQGFLVPWSDMDRSQALDTSGSIRTLAVYWGKKLGRKFSTRKLIAGVLVRREA